MEFQYSAHKRVIMQQGKLVTAAHRNAQMSRVSFRFCDQLREWKRTNDQKAPRCTKKQCCWNLHMAYISLFWAHLKKKTFMTLFSHRNNYFMSMENHSDPKRMANGNAWNVHLRGGWERPCETLVNKSLSASSLLYLVRNSNRRFSPFTKRLLQHSQLVK